MKRGGNWQIAFAIVLVALSMALYVCHYLLFHEGRRIFIDLLEYVAFIPVQVLLVTLVIDKLLRVREKRTLLNKMNMVIGVFFSEVGTDLLKRFAALDGDRTGFGGHLILRTDWSGRDFLNARKAVRNFEYAVSPDVEGLKDLRAFLREKRYFLLRLLENPNLLEHETFTDLLWAVTHLAEEISFRDEAVSGPDEDRLHLAGDVKRAYGLLISEWLLYMRHLHDTYPYLYSLAVRTNPFNPAAKVEFG